MELSVEIHWIPESRVAGHDVARVVDGGAGVERAGGGFDAVGGQGEGDVDVGWRNFVRGHHISFTKSVTFGLAKKIHHEEIVSIWII